MNKSLFVIKLLAMIACVIAGIAAVIEHATCGWHW